MASIVATVDATRGRRAAIPEEDKQNIESFGLKRSRA
jgi:hypothetical protein